ncbi:MAG: hypothetical protein IKX42_09390 [Fibrobacter sp.]|nr:hypothetical protein [Fibrobacter sp.]
MKKVLLLIVLFVLCGTANAYFGDDYVDVDIVYHYDAGRIDSAIGSVLPARVELPTALSKLEMPTNRFNPVYGHVMEYRTKVFSANTIDDGKCRYRDEYNQCVSVMPGIEEYVPADKPEFTDKELFLKDRADKIMQRNDSLFKKAKSQIQSEYRYLSGKAQTIGLHEIKIYVDYYYDSTEKKWIRPDAENCIVTMMMVTKSGVFLHQDKDSTIRVRNYLYHIPEAKTKRLFFDNGYSQVASEIPEKVPLDSIKVFPYKLVFQIPHNKIIDYRKELKNAVINKDYSTVRKVLKKMDNYCARNPFFKHAIYWRHLNMLDVLLQDYSDSNRHMVGYETRIVEYYDDSLEQVIKGEFDAYIQSGEFESALSKENDQVKRAVARILANNGLHDSDEETREGRNDIVQAYLDSISDFEQKKFLVNKYWNREEMHPFYIYFSLMLGATRYVGRLGDRIRPGFGWGGAFGGGNNVMSLDFFLQGFFWSSYDKKAASSRCFKNRNMKDYEFDAMDIGVEMTYKWLVTKRFEGGIYAGPTFNMSEVVKTKWDNDAPRNENEPSLEVAPGLDVGLSFALFEAFNREDVQRMFEPTMYKGGRFGGRLRIGMSTQKTKESFDVWGWKGYITLEGTLRGHFRTRKKPFFWD